MKILFFSQVQQAAGLREVEWRLDRPLSVEAFWEQLLAQYPALKPYRAVTRLARNGEYVAEATLEDGDEIALIPPVSGG